MKFSKIVTILMMVLMMSLTVLAQDSTKTEAPKPMKKHHVAKVKEGTEMKGDKTTKMTKKAKKSKKSKKAEADSTKTEKPAEKE